MNINLIFLKEKEIRCLIVRNFNRRRSVAFKCGTLKKNISLWYNRIDINLIGVPLPIMKGGTLKN